MSSDQIDHVFLSLRSVAEHGSDGTSPTASTSRYNVCFVMDEILPIDHALMVFLTVLYRFEFEVGTNDNFEVDGPVQFRTIMRLSVLIEVRCALCVLNAVHDRTMLCF